MKKEIVESYWYQGYLPLDDTATRNASPELRFKIHEELQHSAYCLLEGEVHIVQTFPSMETCSNVVANHNTRLMKTCNVEKPMAIRLREAIKRLDEYKKMERLVV